MRRDLRTSPAWCLVCGVDSKPVLIFFLWLVGAAVVGTLCVLIWATINGKFADDAGASRLPLAAENGDK